MKSEKCDGDCFADQEEGYKVPDLYGEKRRRNGNAVVLLILFVTFGLPLAGSLLSAGVSIVAALFGVLIGIFGGLFGLIAGGFALVIGLVMAGIGLIISGCMNMEQIPIGLMAIGGGFLSLSAAMLMAAVTKWGCTAVVPGLFRFCIDLIRTCINWMVSVVRRIFGWGGRD